METKSSALMYTQLRKDLLRASAHHRRAIGERMYAADIHRSYLRTCQRQLGALRQAYRRTQEAVAWERYKRAVEQ